MYLLAFVFGLDPISLLVGIIAIGLALLIGFILGKVLTNKSWEDRLHDIRKDAIKRSRAVLGGQFSEQLAPYLPDFPFSPTEARFIGKPIDLIVFKGMDEKEIEEVVFVEIKSGKAKLNTHERKLRDAVKDGKVRWIEYRIPEDLTKTTKKV